MCGIVGVVLKKDKFSGIDLVSALKYLEYRGYDSSGIAFLGIDGIEIIKKKGHIKNILEDMQGVKSAIGIGHTRWATHGEVNDENAHPHGNKRLAIVHNGIIENYIDLKNDLSSKGYSFKTQTDTEVISQLITFYLDQEMQPVEIFKKLRLTLKGTYAIAAIFDSKTLIATRHKSPLIYAGSDEGLWVASDVMAIVEHIDGKISYLGDDETIMFSDDTGTVLYDKDYNVIKPKLVSISADIVKPVKGEFEHFMLKEIFEQPQVVKAISGYLSSTDFQLVKPNKILIIACGTSYYAGLVARYWIESIASIPVSVEIASEFQYHAMPLQDVDLCIFISQSGETFDVLASLAVIQKLNIRTVGIINVLHSTLAREVDFVIPLCAGPEIGVASTKAFTAQMTILYFLANYFGGKSITIDDLHLEDILLDSLKLIPSLKEFTKKISQFNQVFFIGRNLQYPLALEGALKLKEISYINAQAYPAGELKHGPIALIDDKSLVVALSPKDQLFEKTLSNSQEVLSRGAHVLFVTDQEGASEIRKLSQYKNIYCMVVPHVKDELTPFSVIVALQLFAYYSALHLGRSIDCPRNLAKSVTVE